MSPRNTCGSVFGGAAKYKWLVLKIQEYPVNKAMLELAEKNVGPAGCRVKERPGPQYISSPTEKTAVRLADLRRRIREVDRALLAVPEEYRAGVLYHTIHYGTKSIGRRCGSAWEDDMFDFAHKNTWKKWKVRFILAYAGIIGEKDHIDMLNEYREAVEEKDPGII